MAVKQRATKWPPKNTKFEVLAELLEEFSSNSQGVCYLSRPTLIPHVVMYPTVVSMYLSKAFFGYLPSHVKP